MSEESQTQSVSLSPLTKLARHFNLSNEEVGQVLLNKTIPIIAELRRDPKTKKIFSKTPDDGNHELALVKFLGALLSKTPEERPAFLQKIGKHLSEKHRSAEEATGDVITEEYFEIVAQAYTKALQGLETPGVLVEEIIGAVAETKPYIVSDQANGAQAKAPAAVAAVEVPPASQSFRDRPTMIEPAVDRAAKAAAATASIDQGW